jgi:hypothetical protein
VKQQIIIKMDSHFRGDDNKGAKTKKTQQNTEQANSSVIPVKTEIQVDGNDTTKM